MKTILPNFLTNPINNKSGRTCINFMNENIKKLFDIWHHVCCVLSFNPKTLLILDAFKNIYMYYRKKDWATYLWTFLKDKVSELTPTGHLTITELCILFVFFFMASCQEQILKLNMLLRVICLILWVSSENIKKIKLIITYFKWKLDKENYPSWLYIDKFTGKAL